MATKQSLYDALSDLEIRTQELVQAILSVSSAVQNQRRAQSKVNDIITLLAENWE